MKKVKIGELELSKLICGSNTFYGRSHFSNARDREYADRFSDGYLERTIRFCMEKGINAVETSANERIYRIISDIRKDGTLHFIGTTRIDDTSLMSTHDEKLDFLVRNRAEICIIHAQLADDPCNVHEIKGLDRMIEKIHEAGLKAGISTHKISTVELCEGRHDADVYLFPLNPAGFVFPGYNGKETARDRIDIVKGVDKPFILMKTMAAGRIAPDEGIRFALENSKENDIITAGIGSVDEAEELAGIVDSYYG